MRCCPPRVVVEPRAPFLDLGAPLGCLERWLVTVMEEQAEGLELARFPEGFGQG